MHEYVYVISFVGGDADGVTAFENGGFFLATTRLSRHAMMPRGIVALLPNGSANIW